MALASSAELFFPNSILNATPFLLRLGSLCDGCSLQRLSSITQIVGQSLSCVFHDGKKFFDAFRRTKRFGCGQCQCGFHLAIPTLDWHRKPYDAEQCFASSYRITKATHFLKTRFQFPEISFGLFRKALNFTFPKKALDFIRRPLIGKQQFSRGAVIARQVRADRIHDFQRMAAFNSVEHNKLVALEHAQRNCKPTGLMDLPQVWCSLLAEPFPLPSRSASEFVDTISQLEIRRRCFASQESLFFKGLDDPKNTALGNAEVPRQLRDSPGGF